MTGPSGANVIPPGISLSGGGLGTGWLCQDRVGKCLTVSMTVSSPPIVSRCSIFTIFRANILTRAKYFIVRPASTCIPMRMDTTGPADALDAFGARLHGIFRREATTLRSPRLLHALYAL